jgi:hypothetical protein
MRKIILKEQTLGGNETKVDNRRITQTLSNSDYFKILQTSCGYATDYTIQRDEKTQKDSLIKNYGNKGYIKIDVVTETNKPVSFIFSKFKPNTTTPYETGSLALCEGVSGKINSPMGADMITAANAIIDTDKSLFGLTSDNRDKVIGGLANGTFIQVDLNSKNSQIFNKPGVYFVYQQKGVQGTKTNVPELVNDTVKSYGYTFDQPDTADGLKLGKKLGEVSQDLVTNPIIKKQFPNQNIADIYVYPIKGQEALTQTNTKSLADVITNTKKLINDKIDKDTCRDGIRLLYKLKTCQESNKGNCASLLTQFTGNNLDKLKSGVYQCVSQGDKFRNILGVVQLKSKVNDLLSDNGPYGLYQQKENVRQRTMNESYDKHLKNLVKSHLTNLSESKKKSINEDENTIKDTLSSVFSYGLGGGINTIKEKFAEKLIDGVVKGGSNTWVGGVISKAVGTIPIGDYLNGKVYNCDYITKIIAVSIANEAVDKLQDKAGLTGGIFDVIRNSMMSAVNQESEFVNTLTKGLSKVICPLLTDIKDTIFNLFKDKFDLSK